MNDSIIFHITSNATWIAAQAQGSYTADTLATQGFIHCSTADQVLGVLERFYKGKAGLVLLQIQVVKLHAELRWEVSEPGLPPFPHIYGPINLDAVQKASEIDPGSSSLPASPLPTSW